MAKAELPCYVERVPRSMQAERETVINAEMLTRMCVPRDINSLYWSVAMAYLLPVKNNYNLFLDRATIMLGENYLEGFIKLIQREIIDKSTFQSVFKIYFLTQLIVDVFRTRVDHTMEMYAELLRMGISLEDILNMKHETFFTDGIFAWRFESAFPTESRVVELQKLKPEVLNSCAIQAIHQELEKFGDKKKLQAFLCDSYMELLRKSNCWDGQLEIQAMQNLLKCRINVFNENNSIFTVNRNDVNIFLFKIELNFYDFGLVKGKIVMQALKEKNYRKAVDYINVGVDDIHFRDKHKNSLLHLAILSDNQEEIISRLIWQRADVQKKNRNRQTPLDLAKDLNMENCKAILMIHPQELKKRKLCSIS